MKTATVNFILLTMLSLLHVLPLYAAQEIPESAKGHFKAGVALIEKADKPGDFLAAMAELEAAAAIAPGWPDIHFNLAKLAAETDKPAKAISEYARYLALVPEASDRTDVEKEIALMKGLIERKRKIGLPGVKFAVMVDGIATLEVYPGTRIAKTGLQKGDKIVSVNNKSVVGMKLEDFFKAIESSTLEGIQKASAARMYSRFNRARDDQTPGTVMMLKVKRPGFDKEIMVLCKKEIFHSNIIEIEGEEFESEVLKAALPVVVTFWATSCVPCLEFTPIIEEQSNKLSGKVRFININIEENKKLAREYSVKGIPSILLFKGGKLVEMKMGRLERSKVEEFLMKAQ